MSSKYNLILLKSQSVLGFQIILNTSTFFTDMHELWHEAKIGKKLWKIGGPWKSDRSARKSASTNDHEASSGTNGYARISQEPKHRSHFFK